MIADAPRGGARVGPTALAALIHQHAGLEPLLQYSCRDRNLLGIQSDLLGAHAMGVRNLLGITGDVRRIGDYPDATAVFDVDSIGLQHVMRRLNHGLDVAGQPIGEPTALLAGVMVNPAARDLDRELRRFEYKVEAGAEFAVTRPVFDVAAFEHFLAEDGTLPRPDPGRAVDLRISAECRIHGQRSARTSSFPRSWSSGCAPPAARRPGSPRARRLLAISWWRCGR